MSPSRYILLSSWARSKPQPAPRAKHPFSLPYYSPLPTIFVSDLTNPRKLAAHPRWIVRDGWEPLSRFFENHPKPPRGLRSKLCIDESLTRVIPDAWRGLVRARRLISLEASPRSKPHSALLTGLGEPPVLLPRLPSSITTVEAFAPAATLKALRSTFGRRLKPIAFTSLALRMSFEGYLVVELGSKRWVSDSYFLHRALSVGGRLVAPPRPRAAASPVEQVRLSIFHGWEIDLKPPEP